MDPWYKIATPRKEVRDGRSFNPDEFAIALEQVVAGTAPVDYRDPAKFFSRTYFTRALREHTGMVLKRLAGQTANTAPVLTLITQFGGGKTHTLATLYHLVRAGRSAAEFPGVKDLLKETGLDAIPQAKVAVFVGSAWDPQPGRENPWIDIARQLAGDKGVAALGSAAKSTPPGTETINRVFQAADGPVLILFDEVLNFLNRHQRFADSFHAFIQNLTVATTGTSRGAAVISLPRSQVEMSDSDLVWQEKITKVVRRVAKDLIANDEVEISEVVRRRLFEDLGNERVRKNVSKAYADWCFERRAQLPPEWTAVDTVSTESKAREFLRGRFEACYPFHPATLSVFQRKWQALRQYQQTRGTLAMLAQWISWAYRDGYKRARREPLITLGSAPLAAPEFRSVILGQLGESKLIAAIDTDISGDNSHARALDADSKGSLKDIHLRTAAAILFESSGGQVDRVAHLTDLRFALGEPDMDTTSIDSAAMALEGKAFFVRKVGSDGFRISYRATLRKVVNDKRAGLDWETDVKPAMAKLVKEEFDRDRTLPPVWFPEDGTAIQDTPKLTMVVMDPETEWTGEGSLKKQIAEWTKQRGKSPRLYPGSLVWCLKRPGRDLREKVELWLAWVRAQRDMAGKGLGDDYEKVDKAEVQAKVKDAEEAARDEVWAGYRYAILADNKAAAGLKVVDLGAGHSSSNESLCGRILTAMKSSALLNESVGAGYLERNWPNALKKSGEWPLEGLRKSFLDGSLTRLVDPDATLRNKLVEFVDRGDFGLASGPKPDGTYERVYFSERPPIDEVAFDKGVVLLNKAKAKALKVGAGAPPAAVVVAPPDQGPTSAAESTEDATGDGASTKTKTVRIRGQIPPELWNRLGTKLLPKLRQGADLRVGLDISVVLGIKEAQSVVTDTQLILDDLGISDSVEVE